MVQMFAWQDFPGVVDGFCDSDWAGDRGDRKSTSGGVLQIGMRTLKIVALSSGEAEFYAMVKGCAQAKGLCSILRDLGFDAQMHPQLSGWRTDNDIDVQYLWIQNEVANGTVHTRKDETTSNPADLFTKCLPCHIIESHLASLHMYTRSPRSDSSLKLHAWRSDRAYGRHALRHFSEGECEDMITVLLSKLPACVRLWRVPKLLAASARGFKTPDGQQ